MVLKKSRIDLFLHLMVIKSFLVEERLERNGETSINAVTSLMCHIKNLIKKIQIGLIVCIMIIDGSKI